MLQFVGGNDSFLKSSTREKKKGGGGNQRLSKAVGTEGDDSSVIHFARILDVVIGQLLEGVALHEVSTCLCGALTVFTKAWLWIRHTSEKAESRKIIMIIPSVRP